MIESGNRWFRDYVGRQSRGGAAFEGKRACDCVAAPEQKHAVAVFVSLSPSGLSFAPTCGFAGAAEHQAGQARCACPVPNTIAAKPRRHS
jgi:hypothetical protein